MKKPTIKEAAEVLGYKKMGRYYYDFLYEQGYVGVAPYGVEEVYITDGIYANNKGYTGKEVLEMYIKCMEENPEEFIESNKK